MIHRIWNRRNFNWMLFATGSVIALRLFFVQELVAAFIIFSVVFAFLAAVLLALFLVGHGVETAVLSAGKYVTAIGHTAARLGDSRNHWYQPAGSEPRHNPRGTIIPSEAAASGSCQ
jgi:hypothetical protein